MDFATWMAKIKEAAISLACQASLPERYRSRPAFNFAGLGVPVPSPLRNVSYPYVNAIALRAARSHCSVINPVKIPIHPFRRLYRLLAAHDSDVPRDTSPFWYVIQNSFSSRSLAR